jgi:hypothetical protein
MWVAFIALPHERVTMQQILDNVRNSVTVARIKKTWEQGIIDTPNALHKIQLLVSDFQVLTMGDRKPTVQDSQDYHKIVRILATDIGLCGEDGIVTIQL